MSNDKGAKAPTPKSELMKRLRAERKATGLVKVELYVTRKNALMVKAFAATLK